jgi:transcription initiation factor IIF auxiliary subunit
MSANACFFVQVAQARDTTHKVDAKLEDYRASAEKKIDTYRKETGSKLTSAVDQFDKSVEKGAAKSKSWLSGWF